MILHNVTLRDKKSIIINWDVCFGGLIVYDNFNEKYNWFVDYLDKRFKEPNHCINAYYSEIR